MKNRLAILNLSLLGAVLFLNTLSVSGERRTTSATQVVINEIMASNGTIITDEDGDYSDWIEIYNGSDQPINLAGWALSDKVDNPQKWIIPDITLEGGNFLLVWASSKDRIQPNNPLHTNFSISAGGEPVLLTNPLGVLEDQSASVIMPEDISYGRCSDAESNWCFFDQPTPETSNITPGYREVLEAPTFSIPAGFYVEPISLQVSHNDPQATIYYTLDGSEPTPGNSTAVCLFLPIVTISMEAAQSSIPFLTSAVNPFGQSFTNCLNVSLQKIYSYKNQYPRNPGDPFGSFLFRTNNTELYTGIKLITDRSPQPYELAAINTQFTSSTTLPLGNILKGTVLRARAFKNNALPSPIVTRTYFIDSEWDTRYNLPVISIVTEEKNLFDYESGIYVPGKIADDWRLNNPSAIFYGDTPANYTQKGEEWERRAHIEIYSPDGNNWLSQNLGIRIHGGWSRSNSRKSVRLYAGKEYDAPDTFNYPLFAGLEKKGVPGESLQSFKRLILRNSGNDYGSTLFRDGLMQTLVKHTLIDTVAFQPATHFINGEYWGLINIRERYDKYFVASHYELDPDDVVILTGNAVLEDGYEEDLDHYLSTLEYIRQNGVSDPQHYEYLQTRIDTDNFIDYNVAEIYFANTDWPGTNVDYWRKRTIQYEPTAPTGHDGRWRWILYDTDTGFGLTVPSSHNTLEFATATGGPWYPNPDWSTFLLRSCLENQDFRNEFINRFADLLNSAFRPQRVIMEINQMQAAINSEIYTHIQRWRIPASYTEWLANVQVLRNFANDRPYYSRWHIQQKFGLSGSAQLTLQRNLEGGFIQVNSIVIDGNLPGHPSPAIPYPWTGIYFKDVPIQLKALPETGYQFSHWTAIPNVLSPEQATNPQISLMLGQNTILTAFFTPNSN